MSVDEFISIGKYNGVKFGRHSHKHWEIHYYIEGSGTTYIDNVPYAFKKGDILCIPPNHLHYETSDNGYSNYFLWVHQLNSHQNKVYVYHDRVNEEMNQLFTQMHTIYNIEYFNKMAIIGHLLDACIEYFNMYQVQSGQRILNCHVEVARMIENLIYNISNENFNVGEEIKKQTISPTHFRALFKNETGKSPLQYLNELRVNTAKMLIKNSYPDSLSMKEITQMCGFNDQYYFSRLFKKHTGHAPTIIEP